VRYGGVSQSKGGKEDIETGQDKSEREAGCSTTKCVGSLRPKPVEGRQLVGARVRNYQDQQRISLALRRVGIWSCSGRLAANLTPQGRGPSNQQGGALPSYVSLCPIRCSFPELRCVTFEFRSVLGRASSGALAYPLDTFLRFRPLISAGSLLGTITQWVYI
jgi:hypothetical protein